MEFVARGQLERKEGAGAEAEPGGSRQQKWPANSTTRVFQGP